MTDALYEADTTGTGWGGMYKDRYNVSYGYTADGSIEGIYRYSGAGLIDKLEYSYNGSRLVNIRDLATDDIRKLGFNDSTTNGATGTKYAYDESGRLINDFNKDLTIQYNHLDLPEKITRNSDQRILQYTYLADGRRVKKSFNGTARYYINGFEYDGDNLQFVSMPEGRIRPKSGGSWVYDYFIKDHLGNVRVVLTSEQAVTQNYMATMEENKAGEENTYFNNIDATRADRPYNYPDKNPLNTKLAKVPGKSKGPSIMLKVMAGDTIEISAKVFYNMDKTLPGQGVDIAPVLGSAVAAMASSGVSQVGESAKLLSDLGATASQSVALSQVPKDDRNESSPQPTAGINYVLYNANFDVVPGNTGTKVVEDQINKIQTLATDRMVVKESGFLEVFVKYYFGCFYNY